MLHMVDRVRFFSARNFSQSEEVGSSWARTITYDAARTTQRCVNGGGRGLALTQLCARGKEREREREGRRSREREGGREGAYFGAPRQWTWTGRRGELSAGAVGTERRKVPGQVWRRLQ